MFRKAAIIALSATLASPIAAETLRVESRLTVSGTASGILVDGGGGRGARGLWCGAASYASKVLGARTNQRIYVAEGSTINRGLFTLNAAGLTPSSVSVLGQSVRTPGANLTVGHAQGFCSDFRINNGR